MIVYLNEENKDTFVFKHSLARPDLFNDIDFEFWGKIHQYIKECDYPINHSDAFMFVDEYLEAKQKYGGGGFPYNFWFTSEEDKQKFIENFVSNALSMGFKEQCWMREGYRIGSWRNRNEKTE